jgi:putative endonuclease
VAKGRQAEAQAALWLEAAGWTILARNWRYGPGELDIVAARGVELAFVEVKSIDAFGLESIAQSVGPIKRKRIVETAKLFIAGHREFRSMQIRFDIIAMRGAVLAGYLEHAFPEHP